MVASPQRSAFLVALALALTGLACTPVCDEQGLRVAAEHLGTRAPERARPGFEALARACPTLPATLGNTLLMASNAPDQRATLLADRTKDPAWRELFARTCPRTDAEREHALAAEDRDLATRQSCTIDRYELIAPDDAFVIDDMPVFMLYEWMTSGHVDRALARDVVWPLLSASASADELESTCLTERVGCARVMKTWDLELPRSSSGSLLGTGTKILISSNRLSVDHDPLLPLHAGRPAPGAFVRHVAASLRDALADHAERTRIAARTEGVEPIHRVMLIADHATPVGTLVDTLFTATEVELWETELVVLAHGGPRAIPIYVPRMWLPPKLARERTEKSIELTFIVRRDGVEAHAHGMSPRKTFPNRPACEPPPAGCHDHEAIAAFAKQLKNLFPHETVATFRTEDDVPLQALVSLIDTVRGGEDCNLLSTMMGEAVPSECLFYQAILDAEPQLHFRSSRHERLVLGDAKIERSGHPAPGGPSDQALLTAYSTARSAIQRCITERPELLWKLHDHDHDHLTIIYGRSAEDPERTTARAFLDGFLDDEIERCLLAPLGIEPDRRPRTHDFLGATQADLVIPTRFELLGDE